MTARRLQVANDIAANNQKIDGAQAAFNKLVDCRRQEAARLRADVKAGRISQADAGKQMADIRSRYDDDVALGKKISANIATHSAGLEFANEQMKPQPYVAKRTAAIYASMDEKSAKRENLRSGAVVNGAAIDATWVKVALSRDRTGYMLASDLDLQAETIVRNKARRHTPPPSAKGDPVAEGVFTESLETRRFRRFGSGRVVQHLGIRTLGRLIGALSSVRAETNTA